ncbi:hypothetical protein IG631_14612 [Alternaria alternata]|nr:hypothetical protein IG631_14612 [Alternaria alternata]
MGKKGDPALPQLGDQERRDSAQSIRKVSRPDVPMSAGAGRAHTTPCLDTMNGGAPAQRSGRWPLPNCE